MTKEEANKILHEIKDDLKNIKDNTFVIKSSVSMVTKSSEYNGYMRNYLIRQIAAEIAPFINVVSQEEGLNTHYTAKLIVHKEPGTPIDDFFFNSNESVSDTDSDTGSESEDAQ